MKPLGEKSREPREDDPDHDRDRGDERRQHLEQLSVERAVPRNRAKVLAVGGQLLHARFSLDPGSCQGLTRTSCPPTGGALSYREWRENYNSPWQRDRAPVNLPSGEMSLSSRFGT